MPEDKRDYELRSVFIIPQNTVKAHPEKLDEVRDALLLLFQAAIVVNEGQENEERGYVEIIRNGHRLKLSCKTMAKWEVGRGKVV